jgi:peptidoglycan/xylan/chitin deacetylase (PgdA/CDA1 family)
VKERLRILVAACFYYSGLVHLVSWIRRRSGQRLIILNYHRANGAGLRKQLRYLRRHYRLLPLEAALQELFAPQPAAAEATPRPRDRRRQEDRRPPLVVTFDDGYRDNYTHLFPLVCELEVPVTIFLIPGYLDSGAPFWWLEGARLVRHSPLQEVTLAGQTYRLGDAAERRALAQAIDAGLRYAPSVAEREAFLASARQALAVPPPTPSLSLPSVPPAGAPAPPATGEGEVAVGEDEAGAQPLTWAQVREMAASGWVSFGAHTQHHPVLACLRDPAEVAQEVSACRAALEAQLGHPIRTLAYPIGKPRHIGNEAPRAVKEAGYTWALATIEETATPRSDPYLLPRPPGVVTTHWLVMASELVGLLGIWSQLRKLWRNDLHLPGV